MRTASSLLGRRVVTEGGRKVGHCHDLRGELESSGLTVTAIVVGRRGLWEHFGVENVMGSGGKLGKHGLVRWDAVVRLEGDVIVVRDGTEVE